MTAWKNRNITKRFTELVAVVQSLSCDWLCDSMDYSTPGSSVFHYLLEIAQIHVHWVSDAIQPFHPLLPPFSFCLQSFPASRSFPVSRFFTSGGQTTGASASAAVLLMDIQGWFPLGLTSLISLLSKGLSRVFSSVTIQEHQSFGAQPSLWSNSHIHIRLVEKTIGLTIWTFVSKVMPLVFNTLSRFVIASDTGNFFINFQLALKENNFDSHLISWSFGNVKNRNVPFEVNFKN